MNILSSALPWLLFLFNIDILPVSAHPAIFDESGKLHTVNKRFESAEHKWIGDSINLTYPKYVLPGNLFAYTIGSNILSFGDIVATAGDYYAQWSVLPGCPEQVSDNYDTNPAGSIKIFNQIANYLQTDNGGYLGCVLKVQKSQAAAVANGTSMGQDPAQVYSRIAKSYDEQYFSCSQGYAWIALCNFDHFGQDAVRAYKAGHSAAISQALAGRSSGNQTLLTQGYFLEAFAQHYLTDLFAPGHLREPRRVLHWTVGDDSDVSPYPADRCAQKQHDEENANGMWVTNAFGKSWAAYGDKELFSAKSAQNFQQAILACQAGIGEVYNAFTNGVAPAPANYSALGLIPNLAVLTGDNNFDPMFVWNSNDPNNLYLRSNVDRRYNGNMPSPYTAYSNPPAWVTWNSILSTVGASVEDQNLHPYTQGFRSPNQIVHVRQGQNNNLIVNMYGGSPLTTSSWNMLAQTSLPVAAVSGITTWVSMTSPSFNTGIYLLVGRVTVESGTVFPRHLAIQASTELGVPTSTPVTLFWDVTGSDGNTAWREGDSVIGQYSQDSTDLGLVKYFLYNGGPPYKYKLEVWTMPKDMSTTPVLAQTWTTGAINHILNLRYPFFSSPDIMIACGYDNQTATNAWYFATFTNGYKNPVVTTFLDLSVSYPAQAVLAASLDTTPLPQVVRISYGPTYPTPNTIQIDILSINGPAVKLVKTQTFPITWGSLPTTSYLSWNLTTVYFSLYRDLVAYVSDTTNTAPMLIIFPGISGPGFGPPQVVNLSVPTANTSFFSADFMKPVFARGVTVFNPLTSRLRQAGFVSFFDNLGILGVRAVGSNGTTANPYSIGILGQTPGIAGQSSAGLGPRPVDVMGNNAPAEALGFAMVQNN